MRKCEYCGTYVPDDKDKCEACGAWCVREDAGQKTEKQSSDTVATVIADKIGSAIGGFEMTEQAGRSIFVFLICLFLGYFGVHRFVSGKIITGLIWLFTGGLFFVGYVTDIIINLSGMATELKKCKKS